MRRLFLGSLIIVEVFLYGCVPPQDLAVIEREQRRLRHASTRVSKDSTVLRDEVTTIRNEVTTVQEQLADTRATLQELQRLLVVLHERNDEVRHQIDRQLGQSIRKRDKRISSLDVRIAEIGDELRAHGTHLRSFEGELGGLRQAVSRLTRGRVKSFGLGRGKAGVRSARQVEGRSEVLASAHKDYEDARKILERKDYRSAIKRFKIFINKYPKSNFADNAQYWIGESHYALKEFDQAILEFDSVQRKYPKGDKVPAALLKQGFAFAELGDKVDARLILRDLIDRYPKSQEALKAKKKVKSLES